MPRRAFRGGSFPLWGKVEMGALCSANPGRKQSHDFQSPSWNHTANFVRPLLAPIPAFPQRGKEKKRTAA